MVPIHLFATEPFNLIANIIIDDQIHPVRARGCLFYCLNTGYSIVLIYPMAYPRASPGLLWVRAELKIRVVS